MWGSRKVREKPFAQLQRVEKPLGNKLNYIIFEENFLTTCIINSGVTVDSLPICSMP